MPVNAMPWWGWIVIGLLLLGAELMLIEAEFFLVFIGIAAVLTGIAAAMAPGMPYWAPWILFAVLSLVSMVLFRRKVYHALRRQVPDMPDDVVGEEVRITQDLPAGGTCRVDHRGSTWMARNVGPEAIAAGATARIVGVEGISLRVEGPAAGS